MGSDGIIMRMNIGDGKTSYAKNCAIQRAIISNTFHVVDDTLEDMLDDPNFGCEKCYKVVDFGCASGPNSVLSMAHIVDKIDNICRGKMHFDRVPEFEVYLNDLPDNDFNNLFKYLSEWNSYQEGNVEKERCFVYGLPSSFYGRLFARKMLHFAYSSSSIHWLSQIPEGLDTQNGENIYLAGESPPYVSEVYSRQFHRDFSTFLKMRAEEMVQGGRMVLSFFGRSPEDPYDEYAAAMKLLAQSLLDMVTEGLVKREDIQSFNVPLYPPFESEVHTIVENEGSFTLDRFTYFRVPLNNIANDNVNDCPPIGSDKSGELFANTFRAFMEPMITKHFGSLLLDRLFQRYAEKVRDHMALKESTCLNVVIALCRK